MKRVLLSVVAQILWSLPVIAQADSTTVIAGRVLNQQGQPLEGVEVRVVGADRGSFSSAQGSFRLEVPGRLRILVQFRRPGYKPQLLQFDRSWTGNVVLEATTLQLPEIEVVGRIGKPAEYAATNKYDAYWRRRALGFGEFIDRAFLDQRKPLRTAEVLFGRPGIKVDLRPAANPDGSTIVSFSRCNEFPPRINVYLDGKKLLPESTETQNVDETSLVFMNRTLTQGELERRRRIRGRVGEMLDRINPSDIELIEIYRGPGELPAEYNDGNCGAIGIWTKQGH